MRRAAAIGAVLLAAAIAGPAAPAHATRFSEVAFRTSGSIRVVWHGDPARGCEAAGMCAYRGSIVYPMRHGSGTIEHIRRSAGGSFDFGEIESRGTTVARTKRTVDVGPPAVCSQRSRFQVFTLDLAAAGRDRQWLSLGTDVSPAPLATGQCAGPRLEDFLGSLPSALLRRRALDRRGARLSLAGRFRFGSGPLSGEVISTLRLRSRGVQSSRELGGGGGGGDGGGRGGKHRLFVELRYRATRLSGEVRSDFRAIDAPICRLRDACGAHGSEVLSIDEAGSTLLISGSAPTRSRKKPSLRRALRKVLNDGFVSGFMAPSRGSGLTTHAFVRPGAPTCTDRFRPRRLPILAFFGQRGRLLLSSFTQDASILRGRCPGPVDEDARGNEIARVRVARDRLLKRTLRLELRSRRGFRAGAYRATRTARLNLLLRRTRGRVRVDRDFGGGRSVIIFKDGIEKSRARQRP